MTRPRRIDPKNAIHHVFTRGTKRWAIFLDDVDRARFMGGLSRVCDRHTIEVIAFCLLDNHFHLVIRCPAQGLSAALRDLKSLYARFFNDRHGSSGPIYENRFGSVLVTSPRQLRQVVRYVHRNAYAIDSRLELGSYPWCSHAIYLGLRPAPVWMEISEARALFTDYKRSVERPLESDEVQNGWGSLSLVPSAPSGSVTPSLSEILIAVAQAAGVPLLDVTRKRRNGLIGVAILLGREAGYSHPEMCEPFGYTQPAAVATAAHRARKRLNSNEKLATILAATRATLLRAAA